MAGSVPSPPFEATGLLDAIDTLVWVADAATLAFSFVNRQGCENLKHPRERWLQEPAFWSSLLHAGDRAEMLALCSAVASDGLPRQQTHRVADGTGTIRWFRTRIRRIPSTPGEAPALLGEMTEVTDLLQQREVERRNESRLRLMLEQAPAMIWTVDLDLRFTSGAGAGLSHLGLVEDQLVGQRLQDFIDPTGPEVPAHVRALKGEASHFRGRWGERVFETHVEPLRSEGRIVGVIGIAVDITERAQAEEKRRDAERRFQQIVETSEQGIWTIDDRARTTFVNGKMAALLGWPPEEMIGRSLYEHMDESLRSTASENLRRRSQGIRERFVFPFKRRDGSKLWVEMATSPIFDAAGRFSGALAMVSDITARREAEAERERLLQETRLRRELLKLTIEHAPIGIVLLRGADFRVEVANPVATAVALGRATHGARWYDDVMPELGTQTRALSEQVLRAGQPLSLVDTPVRIRRVEGGPLEQAWITSSRVPVPLPDGERGVLLLVNETTDTVRARQEVERLAAISQEKAAELQAILENMADGVTVYDPDGRITFMNAAFTRISGLPPSDLLGQPSPEVNARLDVRDGEGRPLPEEAWMPLRTLAGETVTLAATIAHAGTGRRMTVRSAAAPVRDSGGQIIGAVMVTHDVTAEVEFERLKDQFVEVAAHELKTPVAVMKTNAQLILRTSAGLSPRLSRMAEAIDRGANRIDKIVAALLDLSQLRLNKLALVSTEVDMVRLVERVVQAMGASSSRELRYEHPAELVVRGDSFRFEWLIRHLLDNAIRYSPKGGAIFVRLRSGEDAATLSVQDSGVGIPVESQGHIFERFYRAHARTPEDVGGLGVSLHISREIVHRLGGEMWFESTPGEGSTFFVRIPRGMRNATETGRDRPGGGR